MTNGFDPPSALSVAVAGITGVSLWYLADDKWEIDENYWEVFVNSNLDASDVQVDVNYAPLTLLYKAEADGEEGDYRDDYATVITPAGDWAQGSIAHSAIFGGSDVIPEPASVAVWTTLGLIFGIGVYRRRRKQA